MRWLSSKTYLNKCVKFTTQGVLFACFLQLGFNVTFQACPFWIGVSAKACHSANLEMSPGSVGSQSHSEAVLALCFVRHFFFFWETWNKCLFTPDGDPTKGVTSVESGEAMS